MATVAVHQEPNDDRYKHDAFDFLKKAYPLLSVAAIQRAFRKNNEAFLPSYDALHAIQAVAQDKTIRGLEEKRRVILSIAPFLTGISTIILKNKRKCSNFKTTNRQTSPRLLQDLEGTSTEQDLGCRSHIILINA